MDALDERLVTLLRHDGRRSISDLAVDLGVSRATVRARIERVRGIMMIEVEGHAADRVVRALGGFPEISAVHTTNGRWDLVVELNTETLTQLDAVLRKVRLIPAITGSETTLLLATPRSTRARL